MTETRKPRVSNAELAVWTAVAQRFGGGKAYEEGSDGVPVLEGVPYFGAAVFDLRDERRRVAELEGMLAVLLNGVRAALLCRTPFNAIATLEAIIVDAEGSGMAAAALEYRERIRRETLEQAAALLEKQAAAMDDESDADEDDGVHHGITRNWRMRSAERRDAASAIRALATEAPE